MEILVLRWIIYILFGCLHITIIGKIDIVQERVLDEKVLLQYDSFNPPDDINSVLQMRTLVNCFVQ